MDVVFLGGKTLRIKGKNGAIVVNPTSSISKTEADAIVLSSNFPDFSDVKVEGSRITIKGPGEYELGGIKISAISRNNDSINIVDVDNVKILLGDGLAIEKNHEKTEGFDIAVINADNEFDYSIISSLEPKVLIVYGEKKNQVLKSLGKEDAPKSSKFSTTFEKLPSEMQVVSFE